MSGDEMQAFPSSQTVFKGKRKIQNRLPIKKAAGKIKTVKYVVGMLFLHTSQIPTGKNAMQISVNKQISEKRSNKSIQAVLLYSELWEQNHRNDTTNNMFGFDWIMYLSSINLNHMRLWKISIWCMNILSPQNLNI